MGNRNQWLTAANVVTLIRLLLTVPVVYALLQEESVYQWVGLILFVVAAASDGLDGYLARSRGEVTKVGQLLDPVCDKVLGIAVFGVLVFRGVLPVWMLWTLIGKEVLLLLGGALLLAGGREVSSARPLGKVATVILFSGFVLVIAGIKAGSWVVGGGVALSVAAGLDYAIRTLRAGSQRL